MAPDRAAGYKYKKVMRKKLLLLFPVLILFCSCGKEKTQTVDKEEELKNLPYGLSVIPEKPSADESCTLYYKAGGGFPFEGYTASLYAHIGIVNLQWEHVQAEWNENIDKCLWQKTEVDNLWALSITPSIREWFGAGEDEAITKIGVVVRSADGKKQTVDLFCAVEDSAREFKPDEVVIKSLPQGLETGINYVGGTQVSLVLYDRDSQGGRYEHALLVGDFNDWTLSHSYEMYRDEDASCWWIELNGLNSKEEYRFQYHLISSDGEAVRLSDPYSQIVYSTDDQWISSSTYPGLPSYPDKASGLVSAFQIDKQEYEWKIPEYKVADPDDLIIYELHLRDFSASKDLAGVVERLDYIKNLGINAIELMPIQEFDGNDSWGYNPCSYFALDKAYGTRQNYKEFVDECHSRGLAVLVDVVYNHVTGSHPMAKMYWDASSNKTSVNNPFFNVDAPHPYSVFHDWNHENPVVRDHIKRSLAFLLDEYHFDGFRFDLTKGFTQKKSNDSSAASYDASRIAILKDYASFVFEKKPEAVVIFEHFCETREENELAQSGIKLWRNLNNAYCQTAMGWLSDGDDLSGMWTGTSMPFGSLVGFQESHDEERTAYKALKWGNGITGDLTARMQREALNAAFSLLVPGLKMIWQFEELGYDVSIEENGRTGAKPLHWDYLDVPQRKGLYDEYSRILSWRSSNPEFFRSDVTYAASVFGGKKIRHISVSSSEGGTFFLVGNFDVENNSQVSITLPSSGLWRDTFSGEEFNVPSGGELVLSLDAGEYKLLENNDN